MDSKKWLGYAVLVIVVTFGAKQCGRFAAEQQNARDASAARVANRFDSSQGTSGSKTQAETTEGKSNPSAFLSRNFDDISIELPKNWQWMGQADAVSLNTNSEALADSLDLNAKQGNNTVLVAGNAFNDAKVSVATVRLSIRPVSTISQNEMQQALKEPQEEIIDQIMSAGEETAAAMRRLPNISSYKVLDGALKDNGSLVCSWTQFEYDAGKGPTISDLWICPLGDRNLKLGTSYNKDRANLFSATINHIWRSLSSTLYVYAAKGGAVYADPVHQSRSQ